MHSKFLATIEYLKKKVHLNHLRDLKLNLTYQHFNIGFLSGQCIDFFIIHLMCISNVERYYLSHPTFSTLHRVFQAFAPWESWTTRTSSCWETKPWIVHPAPSSTSLCARVCMLITVCALFVLDMRMGHFRIIVEKIHAFSHCARINLFRDNY